MPASNHESEWVYRAHSTVVTRENTKPTQASARTSNDQEILGQSPAACVLCSESTQQINNRHVPETAGLPQTMTTIFLHNRCQL